ncbi:MAG: hypothetical protein GC186_17750 [Rhodobacteraceae bacterium]|nr:hypothetical protein [Paracoccaceae bacterium]
MRNPTHTSVQHRSVLATFAAAIRTFHPGHLRHNPVAFSTALAAVLTGLMGLRDMIAGDPKAIGGLELSGTFWLLAFLANFIDALAEGRRNARR